MKQYKDYMDGVTVSDTLHQRLTQLEPPAKKPAAWQKYGALAAALVLVVALGVWGLSGGRDEIERGTDTIGTTEQGTTEPALEPVPDPMPDSPGMETMGGYEVSYGETVAYFMLPYIHFGQVENEVSADIALPVGVTRRDLTEEELLVLLGGETNLTAHLDWGGYTVSAHAMVWPDESLWLLAIHGTRGDSGYDRFVLEVMPGQLPPTCIVYPESVVNNIWEREVTASRFDTEIATTMRVSFLDEDYGYRFSVTGAADSGIDERVSRLVRWVIVGDGLTLEAPAENMEMTTMPYDPAASSTPEGNSTPAYDPGESEE